MNRKIHTDSGTFYISEELVFKEDCKLLVGINAIKSGKIYYVPIIKLDNRYFVIYPFPYRQYYTTLNIHVNVEAKGGYFESIDDFIKSKEHKSINKNNMKTYVLVTWPDSQEYMDEDWFDEEAFLAEIGDSAYFIPEDRVITKKDNLK